MLHLILIGAPGSGKGTQAANLVSQLGYKHLSTGDLLRSEISKGSELGKRVSGIISEGKLVDDMTVLELLRVNSDLSSGSYIFDGFPRNVEQAVLLEKHILGNNKFKVVYFEVDLEALKSRLVNRRTCPKCGEIYNLVFKKPSREDTCDKCGTSGLTHRKDDKEDVVVDRLNVFKQSTLPLLDYYNGQGVLSVIDASLPTDKVFNSVKNLI